MLKLRPYLLDSKQNCRIAACSLQLCRQTREGCRACQQHEFVHPPEKAAPLSHCAAATQHKSTRSCMLLGITTNVPYCALSKCFLREPLPLLKENIYGVVPAVLVPSSTVSIGKVGMHGGHQSVFFLFLKGHRNHRLLSRCVRRHPSVPNSTRSL